MPRGDPDHHLSNRESSHHVKNRRQRNTPSPTTTDDLPTRDQRHDIFEERHNHRDLQLPQQHHPRHRRYDATDDYYTYDGLHAHRQSGYTTRKSLSLDLHDRPSSKNPKEKPQNFEQLEHRDQSVSQQRYQPQHHQQQHLQQPQQQQQELQPDDNQQPEGVLEQQEDSDHERRQLLVDIFYERHLQEERDRGIVELKDHDTLSDDEEQIKEEG